MKSWEVIITPEAEADATEAFEFIAANSPLNAARWLMELYQAIDGLASFRGYARAREDDWIDFDLRQKVFKSHRIVYSVARKEKRVYVHYVRHGARDSGPQAEGKYE